MRFPRRNAEEFFVYLEARWRAAMNHSTTRLTSAIISGPMPSPAKINSRATGAFLLVGKSRACSGDRGLERPDLRVAFERHPNIVKPFQQSLVPLWISGNRDFSAGRSCYPLGFQIYGHNGGFRRLDLDGEILHWFSGNRIGSTPF